MPEERDLHQFDLMDAMEEGVCFLSEDHVIIFTNTQVEEMTGIASGDLLGTDFLALFPGRFKAEIEEGFHKARQGERVQINASIRSAKKNAPIPVLLRLVVYSDPLSQKGGIYALILDLSELVDALRREATLTERNKALEDLVVTCPLTGIYNRRYFELRYDEEMDRAKRYGHGLGLAMIDADRFKEINDLYGHQVGDQVLIKVAHTLRDTIRNTDIVARYGGDEFVIVLPEMKPEGIFPLAIRLRQRVQDNTVDSPQGPIQLTISVGLSCTVEGDPSLTKEELLHRADESLYKAKEGGRNRIVFYGHPSE